MSTGVGLLSIIVLTWIIWSSVISNHTGERSSVHLKDREHSNVVMGSMTMYGQRSDVCKIMDSFMVEIYTHRKKIYRDLTKHSHQYNCKYGRICQLVAFVLVTYLHTALGIAFAHHSMVLSSKECVFNANSYTLESNLDNGSLNVTTDEEGWFRYKQIRNSPLPGGAHALRPCSPFGIKNLKQKMGNCTHCKKDFQLSWLWDCTYTNIHHISVQLYPCSTLNDYLSRKTTSHITQDEEMTFEICRLLSFHGPQIKTSCMMLARSGFFATGNGDETQCYSCRKTYRNWQMMDKPDDIHRAISPVCLHLNGRDTRNIPITSSTSDNVASVCGIIDVYSLTDRSQTTTVSAVDMGESTGATASPVTTIPHLSRLLSCLDISRAVYPQYRDSKSRLDSYHGWAWSHVQDPHVLTDAGFYYAGYRDCVRCFYCGVGLRTWEKEDNPWVEHVRWRSSCDYVRCMKGEQFVIGALAVGDCSDQSSSPKPVVTVASSQQKQTVDDVIAKAEEMGFTREASEKAIEEIQAQNQSRGSGETNRKNDTLDIQLETLLEKLFLTNQEPAAVAYQNQGTEEIHYSLSAPLTPAGGVSRTRDPTSSTHPRLTGSVNTEAPDQTSFPAFVSQLEEENQALRDESTCKVCLDNPSCIVFLPCGHLVTCAECAPALRKCPICRALIRGTVRTNNA